MDLVESECLFSFAVLTKHLVLWLQVHIKEDRHRHGCVCYHVRLAVRDHHHFGVSEPYREDHGDVAWQRSSSVPWRKESGWWNDHQSATHVSKRLALSVGVGLQAV